jgi:uncharacterized protein YkwD
MPASRTITIGRVATAALTAVMTLSLLPAATIGANEPPRAVRQGEWKALAAINHLRANRGLKPLRMAQRVRLVARDRSRDMRQYRYFGHASPSGRDAASLLGQRNIRYLAGSENIGWVSFMGTWEKSADAIADAWFDSSGHRANLLSDDYNYVGIGAARSGNAVYWTAIFVRQRDHTAPKAGMIASPTGLSLASNDAGSRRVTIRWWGHDRALQRHTSGLKGFIVQKRKADGTWRTLRYMTKTRSLTTRLREGTHKFRVRAVDNRGNKSGWRHPLTVTVH